MSEFVSFIGDSFANQDDAVKVVLRIRPPFENETDDLAHFKIISANELNVRVPESSWTFRNIRRNNLNTSYNFSFAHVFDWNATQTRIFDAIVDLSMLDFLSGKNALVFTYGTTNAGKTYSLIGNAQNPGILPRALDYVFGCLRDLDIGHVESYKKSIYNGVEECAHAEIVTKSNEKRRLLEIIDKGLLKNNYIIYDENDYKIVGELVKSRKVSENDKNVCKNTKSIKKGRKNSLNNDKINTEIYNITKNIINDYKNIQNNNKLTKINEEFDENLKNIEHVRNIKNNLTKINENNINNDENINNKPNDNINFTETNDNNRINSNLSTNNYNLRKTTKYSDLYHIDNVNNENLRPIPIFKQHKNNLPNDIITNDKNIKVNKNSHNIDINNISSINNSTNINNSDSQINLGIDVMNIHSTLHTTHYIYISIAEIYNEQIFDLLEATFDSHDYKRSSLKIHGNNKNGFYVKNLKSILVTSTDEAMKILEIGLQNRRIAETKMNSHSSRSHVIYNITLIRITSLPNGSLVHKVSEICFVDLAGAERQSTTSSEGERLREASNINKSLLFLNRCIQELRETRLNNHGKHIPYRESKLTQLLQSYFVGKARMTLLINISPCIATFDDTFSVLRFSSFAKQALDRPLGVELDNAIKLDEIIAKDVDLQKFSKSELIELVNGLRLKLITSAKQIETYDTLLREEMCQFTHDMMEEIDAENERKIQHQRTLVAESYLVKIEILEEEIGYLHDQLLIKDSASSNYTVEIENLKKIIAEKEIDFNQLMADVDSFKMDSKLEINKLESEIDNLKGSIIQKCKENSDLISNIEQYHVTINEKDAQLKILQDLQQNNEKIKIEKHQIYEKYKILKSEHSKLKNLYTSLQRTVTRIGSLDFKDYIDEIQGIYHDFSNYMEFSRKSINDICSKIAFCKKEIESRDENISGLQQNVQQLQAKNNVVNDKVEEYKNKINNIYSEIDTLNVNNKKKLDELENSMKNLDNKLILCSTKRDNIENLKRKYAEDIKEINIELEEKKKKIENSEEIIRLYEIEKTSNEKEKDELKNKITELTKKLEFSSNHQTDAKKDAKIMDLESQLKGYKDLNEEYRLTVKRLEDTITERKLMAPVVIKPVFEPVKRPTSPNTKENYDGIFSKKNRMK